MAKKSKQAKSKKQGRNDRAIRKIRYQLKQAKDYQALAKLPKDSNPNRLKNRDMTDGRPRGYMRKFGLHGSLFDNWHMKANCQV